MSNNDIQFRIYNNACKYYVQSLNFATVSPFGTNIASMTIIEIANYLNVNGITNTDNFVFQQYILGENRNKKKIYVGDIVIQTDGKFPDNMFRGIVEYDIPNSAFVIRNSNGKITGVGGAEVYVEVIGNIFENPELI